MKDAVKVIAGILSVSQLSALFTEAIERLDVFSQARKCADSHGKPLLVVGTPKKPPWGYYHPCGDVTIDIDPDIESSCEYKIVDVRAMPYSNSTFGAAYISHVLEHLPTVADAYQALNELHRVADNVFVVSPHKFNITAWLHPGHHLWVLPDSDSFIIEQRGRQL